MLLSRSAEQHWAGQLRRVLLRDSALGARIVQLHVRCRLYTPPGELHKLWNATHHAVAARWLR